MCITHGFQMQVRPCSLHSCLVDNMIEPVPQSWPVRKLGYKFMVNSVGKRHIFVDAERLDWCAHMFGDMHEGGYIDQGSWMCFKDSHSAALYDMTWS